MEPPKGPRLWGPCPAAMDGFNFQHRPLPLSIEVVGPRACLGITSATIQQGRQCAAQPQAWRCPSPGVRGPVFGEPPALPHASAVSLGEGQGSEVDVSDLGSRNYSARTDFYCLVLEDDV